MSLFALKGDTFDGHDFLSQAIAAGAGCLVISKKADFEKYSGIPRFSGQGYPDCAR